MSATVLQFSFQDNIDQLMKQLDCCPHIQGKGRKMVEDFLLHEGVYSLHEVNETVYDRYCEYLNSQPAISDEQFKYYASALELHVSYYFAEEFHGLAQEMKEYGRLRTTTYNKILYFLAINNIQELEDIDYKIREKFEKYLLKTKYKNFGSIIKALDWLKLYSIEKKNRENTFRKYKLEFKEELFYLGYHPDYQTAMNFYYIQDKSELVFDFSLKAPIVMKRQIFAMLNYVLQKDMGRKLRRELYIVPLKLFYMYCVRNKIEDIEELEYKDVVGFRQSIDGHVGTKTNIYMQIVHNIRKYLFLTSSKTNWNANIWFLERFNLKGDRMNPAAPVEAIHFYLIEDKDNRRLLQAYLKYCIGVGNRAISTIRLEYYNIYEFLQYCDSVKISAQELDSNDFEYYVEKVDSRDVQSETYNQKICDINRFYLFLLTKGYIKILPFTMEYYLKKSIIAHHDRCVPEDTQRKLLENLKYFPVHLRLMYLNLWCVGLRLNEVCCLKGNAYFWENNDAWIRVHQYKMKSDKIIPIPSKLYELMKQYIEDNQIGPDEFIFKNQKGSAFASGTFRTQMVEWCEKFDIRCEEYVFRSHDYRHTIGTKLYDDGVSIQAIRDYLGHREEDMTKQYLDYVPKKIDEANEAYFNGGKGLAEKISAKGVENE